ncbi:hypothetical protein NWP17_05580 [Chrysosporum bergii ANA360D]|uniref:DUF3782 domain-containing protein n=1 Tax=Chrysosporum bergii ANA360D TaxID=617107 RepID=A0AA43GQP8_9CYAN|nr:hypothetical protein [Chrysosporum bergii]MDH6059911.1 hypothetical protein [Chrysosporum bergii ANA360D]
MTYTPDDVWRLLGELIAAQKETERRFQETDRILKEQSQETDRILKEQSQETDRRFQETDRLLKEQSQETDRILKEQSQKTDRQIQRVSQDIGKLGNRLGEFVEWQVRPAAVQLFQQRGIDVHEIQAGVSVKRNGEGLEIDLLVINDTEAVLIEVKSKLTQPDVDKHLERLDKFKRLVPRYQDVRAMAAVAAMVVPDEVRDYAYSQGLFVLAQSGDNLVILNQPNFHPRTW